MAFVMKTFGILTVSIDSGLACPTNANFNNCSAPVASSTGDVYNIASLIGLV